jgi:hypothetical protein
MPVIGAIRINASSAATEHLERNGVSAHFVD